MLTRLRQLYYVVFRGGTPGFNGPELRVLSAVLESLPDDERDILAEQIGSVHLVQRAHPGRIIAAYYRCPNAVRQLPFGGYECCLAAVTYRSSGKRRKTWVMLHDGRLMTLERAVPQTESEIDSVVKVQLHPTGFSPVTAEIDAEEHGSA